MARPKVVSDEQIERVAALYAVGGTLAALAVDCGVCEATLRLRLKKRYGRLPARLPKPADDSALDRAALLLEGLATAARSDELVYLAREVRAAAKMAKQIDGRILALGLGKESI